MQLLHVSKELVTLEAEAEKQVAVIMKRGFICPKAGCGHIVDATGTINSGCLCHGCNSLACGACYQAFRRGHTHAVCEANQHAAALAKFNELCEMLKMTEEVTRCCAACLQLMQRQSGCNIVQCLSCMSYSCWECGNLLVSPDELDGCYFKVRVEACQNLQNLPASSVQPPAFNSFPTHPPSHSALPCPALPCPALPCPLPQDMDGRTVTPNYVAHRHSDDDMDLISRMPQRLQDLVTTRQRNGHRCATWPEPGEEPVVPELELQYVRKIMFPNPPVADP